MTAATRRLAGILVGAAVVLTGSALAERSALLERRDVARSATAQLAAGVVDARAAGADWSALFGERVAESARYERLLAGRVVFVEAVGGMSAALESASGKVDTTTQRSDVHRLQDAVHAERRDAEAVVRAASAVDAAAAAVRAAVAAYDEEQRRLAEAAAAAAARAAAGTASRGSRATIGARLPASGTAYDRVRAALDRVGGGGVPLEQYEGACGTVRAAACARSNGVIRFTSELATWSDARLNWAMAHELAHIRQFPIWGALLASNGYATLFGGDIELLANCMAQQRGYPGGSASCSAAQVEWSAAVWNGSVPG